MSKRSHEYEVSGTFGTVSTRIDLDGEVPLILLCPDRNKSDYKIELFMTPAVARKVARALNKAARQVQS